MICEASFHCRSDAQSLMDAAEIVVRMIDCHHVAVILKFFEKPFVSRVKRRTPILKLRFCLSM
jgi:hypothetical protein